ncbi:hypothetical protein ACH5RR_026066, partial [Cinchona calisaya]
FHSNGASLKPGTEQVEMKRKGSISNLRNALLGVALLLHNPEGVEILYDEFSG